MPTVTVTGKGQIAIPAAIRRHLGIQKGTRLHIQEIGEVIVLKPLTPQYLEQAAGFLAGPASLSRQLLRERAAESVREGD